MGDTAGCSFGAAPIPSVSAAGASSGTESAMVRKSSGGARRARWQSTLGGGKSVGLHRPGQPWRKHSSLRRGGRDSKPKGSTITPMAGDSACRTSCSAWLLLRGHEGKVWFWGASRLRLALQLVRQQAGHGLGLHPRTFRQESSLWVSRRVHRGWTEALASQASQCRAGLTSTCCRLGSGWGRSTPAGHCGFGRCTTSSGVAGAVGNPWRWWSAPRCWPWRGRAASHLPPRSGKRLERQARLPRRNGAGKRRGGAWCHKSRAQTLQM